MNKVLDFCHEFGHGDDSNEWKKSTKEAYKDKDFYCNLESKNLFNHLSHYCMNSSQIIYLCGASVNQ